MNLHAVKNDVKEYNNNLKIYLPLISMAHKVYKKHNKTLAQHQAAHLLEFNNSKIMA